MDYKLLIYVCKGTVSEKLKWFNVINIQGERLSEQEMRNAVFTGAWLTDAKKRFSKATGKGVLLGTRYLAGDPKRQKYLETAIKHSDEGGDILMSWPSKDTLICQQETADRTIDYFERKGWHAYRIYEIDYEKIKGELS